MGIQKLQNRSKTEAATCPKLSRTLDSRAQARPKNFAPCVPVLTKTHRGTTSSKRSRAASSRRPRPQRAHEQRSETHRFAITARVLSFRFVGGVRFAKPQRTGTKRLPIDAIKDERPLMRNSPRESGVAPPPRHTQCRYIARFSPSSRVRCVAFRCQSAEDAELPFCYDSKLLEQLSSALNSRQGVVELSEVICERPRRRCTRRALSLDRRGNGEIDGSNFRATRAFSLCSLLLLLLLEYTPSRGRPLCRDIYTTPPQKATRARPTLRTSSGRRF